MDNLEITARLSADPFLQRAIEHWLDAANELSYQPLFCQWLTTKGHVLKYSIKNTNFEQGKDVVSVAPDGVPHGYQLKGGSINLNRWRKEVKPEIDILVEGAIQHPDIDNTKGHVSYLVTNGEIDETVRADIISLNQGRWKETPLKILTRGDLLSGFQGMAEGIFPRDAQAYKELTDLMFANGTALPDVPKVSSFLDGIFDHKEGAESKERSKRDIAAALLYASIIAAPFRVAKNYASVAQVMTLLISKIFSVVDTIDLKDEYWLDSYQIAFGDLLANAKALEAEVNEHGFDHSITSPLDRDVMALRKHAAMSVIYPLKLAEFMDGDEGWKSVLNEDVLRKYMGTVAIWGEASFILPILTALIFKNVSGGQNASVKLLVGIIDQLVSANGRASKNPIGLLPPYFDIEFAMQRNLGMIDEIEEDYKLGSYLLQSIIEVLVRMEQRDVIAERWKEISFFHFEELISDDPVDYYKWRIEKGENRSIVPKKEKSWKEMFTEANTRPIERLPKCMHRFPSFLPFFLSIFPFRINVLTMSLLDKAMDVSAKTSAESL